MGFCRAVANVQTNSKRDPQDNIREVSALIREAKAKGADLIVTPEVVGMIEPKRELGLAKAKPEETHEVLAAFRALAAELGPDATPKSELRRRGVVGPTLPPEQLCLEHVEYDTEFHVDTPVDGTRRP